MMSEEKMRMTLATRIREERTRLGMTQHGLERAAGLTKDSVWRIESGLTKKMAIYDVTAIAEALYTSVSYLCGESDFKWGSEAPFEKKDEKIHCKDCRHFSLDVVGMRNGSCKRRVTLFCGEKQPTVAAESVPGPDHYCGYAERRDDE